MRQWVTASVMKNQSAMATARSFQNSYGEEFESVLAQDQAANGAMAMCLWISGITSMKP